MENLVNDIQKEFDKEHLFASVYYNPYVDAIKWEIEWGDWKHDHLRSEYVFEDYCAEHGYEATKLYSCTTEENGSDCYSALHAYRVNKKSA